MAFIENKQVMGDTIDTIAITTVYISNIAIDRVNDRAVGQYGYLGPIQDSVDEIVQSRQLPCLDDNECDVRAVIPELIKKIVDVVRDKDV